MSRVSIEIRGGAAIIEGCPPEIMGSVAEPRLIFAVGKAGQVSQHFAAIPLSGQDRNGCDCISVGLVPRVTHLLQQHGIPFDLVDRRNWGNNFQVDHDVTGHDIYTEAMLRAVTKSPIGQLVLNSRKHAIPWIGAICRFFPRANILIMVGTPKRARQIWMGLSDYLGRDVVHYHGNGYAGSRCVVTTYRTFSQDAGDVIILPEPQEAIGKRAADIISLMLKRERRVYALVQPDLRMSQREQIRLEQLTGPVIYDARPKKIPVYVSMADAYSMPIVDESDALTWKRTAYWHNNRRNDAIAALARAAASGDMAALWQAGILIDEDEAYLNNVKPSDVSVLVESTEHGQEMHRRLPGWHLHHLRPGESAAASAAGIQGPAGEVVTATYAAQHGVQAGILIRADGGDSPMSIKGFPANEGTTPLDSALVIDVSDNFCRRASRDTNRRCQHYRRAGWHVDGDQDNPSKNNPLQTVLPDVPAGIKTGP